MAFDTHKNLAYSTVATAPSPASSGTSIVVESGHGTRFPAVPFNATVWAADEIPTPSNSEIVRVTNIATDTLTITRAQETGAGGPSARTVVVGDQIAATITAKTLTDIEDGITPNTSTITTTGTQTALALPTGDADLVIFANNASLLTLQGLAAGADGQRLTMFSIGAGQVDLAHQNGSATATDRIITMPSATISLAAGAGRAELIYDATTGRWRVVEHDQGAWIDYYASSTITGWSSLTSGRRQIYYKLRNRTVEVLVHLEGTSNATTVSLTIPFAIGGSTYPFYAGAMGYTYDSGATTTPGHYEILGGASTISCYKDSAAGTWTASGTKIVNFNFVYHIG